MSFLALIKVMSLGISADVGSAGFFPRPVNLGSLDFTSTSIVHAHARDTFTATPTLTKPRHALIAHDKRFAVLFISDGRWKPLITAMSVAIRCNSPTTMG